MHGRLVHLVAVAALFHAGCYSWITVHQAPAGSEASLHAPASPSNAVACIGDARVGDDGDALLVAFRDRLAAAGVFADVRMTRCDGHDATVLNIVRVDRSDPHVGRMIVTSATFVAYGLGTLLPYRYEYALDLAVEAVRGDGVARHYRSTADASEYYTIWERIGGDPQTDVRTIVTDRVVNDIVNQFVRDREFFANA
jgi:hypothetical protein